MYKKEHKLRTTHYKQLISGFTLLEILVVLVIIAIILTIGLTLTSTANKQFSFPAMRGAIISLLRYARSQAITEKDFSYVLFNLADKKTYCISSKNIRLWHMENLENNKTTGAFGFDGNASGQVKLTSEGRYGNAFLFNGNGMIDCGDIKFRGNETGLVLETWIYPVTQTNQIFIQMKENYYLKITKKLEFVCNLGALNATSLPDLVQLEKWVNVRITYETESPFLYQTSSGTLKMYVNNILVAEASSSNTIANFDSLTISSATQPFYGKIDEVKINVLVESDKQELQPPNIVITSNLKTMDNVIKISFDSDGNLFTKPSDNSSTADITFSAPSTRESFSVIIDPFGMVKIQ